MDFVANTEIIRATQKQSDKAEQATIKMFYQIEQTKINGWEEMAKDWLLQSEKQKTIVESLRTLLNSSWMERRNINRMEMLLHSAESACRCEGEEGDEEEEEIRVISPFGEEVKEVNGRDEKK
ncbi:uncharacterized protein MONOS_18315 [Monocercomonoides exilis]|uniref:uncharacterized protein n=1 Tax=Monocercomonoides exilis TaxID=2049356 RepID=UPI003559BD21|nr:hypothetical protein MONOS_18315 [Monocercomonoides exilis]